MSAMGRAVERGVELVRNRVLELVPEPQRATWTLRSFGLTKVPLLLYCLPRVEQLDRQACTVAIPLTWRTRNHYRSMYFGALAVGADCTAGMLAMHHTEKHGGRVQLLFKDFHAEFIKRAEHDVHFVCRDGQKIAGMVQKAVESGERVNDTVWVEAQVPKQKNEVVAKFSLTLSLKSSRASAGSRSATA